MGDRTATSQVSLILSAILVFSVLIHPVHANQDCKDCHKQILNKRVVHPAIEMGCDACHEGTPHPHEVPQNVNELCLQCHDQHFQNENCNPDYNGHDCGHPVPGHPTTAPNDLLYPDRKFTCVSCHNPHSSNQDKLFRYDYRAKVTPYQGFYCLVCHWDKYNSTPAPPTPPWNP